MKYRLDQLVHMRGLVPSRSQAESWIRLGKVKVNGKVVTKAGEAVDEHADIQLTAEEQYVSRAGLKLASVAKILKLDFKDKVMLDVGSSTGGFTDYALRHGARKVVAIDVGTNQLHPSLRGNPKIELHEQTDIRDVLPPSGALTAQNRHAQTSLRELRVATSEPSPPQPVVMDEIPDIVVIDVSFISLREILPHVARLSGKKTQIAAMVKPQFEAVAGSLKHKGVIKNDRMRRDILKAFEDWARGSFVVVDKADSDVAGSKGNLERFYLLVPNITE
jgi:23S rRNA (cytidine1920-2'-O)/16S rRNA (cytidine1409-2'-O)-methyltransferase